ncbi:hypothetical protein [Algoriphagus yeomjeoni]|uniref:Uncharacterized protein n=1 Tax=Algoriphagus yeomjeoni TaxID=291403 RepID=A0A327NXC0_9BACT|nr:hypothetical protein [Algoriphagus yeomjeoni]RAI84679.1 hypothetical protein LV83_03936 [Algoriphagus yeomjeoni]
MKKRMIYLLATGIVIFSGMILPHSTDASCTRSTSQPQNNGFCNLNAEENKDGSVTLDMACEKLLDEENGSLGKCKLPPGEA